MRVFLEQLGCRLNFSENDTLAARLSAAGHRIVRSPEDAHVIVLNTCAVTAQAASRSRQAARHLHKRNPDARIAMTGCYATLAPQESAQLPGVALVADNQGKEMLHTLLEPWSAAFSEPDDLARIQPHGSPFAAAAAAGRNGAHARLRKGPGRLREPMHLLHRHCVAGRQPQPLDIGRGAERAEFGRERLSGGGAHRRASGRVRSGPARRPARGPEGTDRGHPHPYRHPRLRLSSLEPWELADGFFDLWQRWPGRLCPHLHLPLQAGVDAQLRRMARRCTVDSFRQLVADARAAIPDLILTTDLIVGFPGETEADFEEGLRFVEEVRFAHAHIFPFSARAGTAAASFDRQVPNALKKSARGACTRS